MEEELLSLSQASLIFHIKGKHGCDSGAEVRALRSYILGKTCPHLCYFASVWERKRTKCSFIDQPWIEDTGQTQSFPTSLFFFFLNSELNQTVMAMLGQREPGPRTGAIFAAIFPKSPVTPQGWLKCLLQEEPYPCHRAQPGTGPRADSNAGHSAATGKRG